MSVTCTSRNHFSSLASRSQGFTLIEVLVSLIVLTIGCLGIATMQLQSMQNNQGAYMRSQAVALASGMLDRILSNREGRVAGAYDAVTLDAIGDVPAKDSCLTEATGCNGSELATNDIYELGRHFWDVETTTGYKPTLPGGRAAITKVAASNEYVVTIFWTQRDWATDGDDNAVRGSLERSLQLRTRMND
ncbi:hypothetical protein A3709_20095 [Halioglobus sp. HI00S01]|uniref:type IV pilus modification protein PilV n=1 Tax=Halioglobus sp. HI00S01 TaxID=1822214 RepID=UPI0007C346D8|nr:type IV pilus modification protein PilV [Halioglobus sp. HI00S01]KZX57928.1 hypothetical protein A3709_20095 [Halioglobus sp. HI00S01]